MDQTQPCASLDVADVAMKECPHHQGHKGPPEVTPGTCATLGEEPQVVEVEGHSDGSIIDHGESEWEVVSFIRNFGPH